ncbi:MAG: ABC transporter permease [Acidobacteriota bacterium]|nr:ABC transporter permease [Acidobacteriota bacterium]
MNVNRALQYVLRRLRFETQVAVRYLISGGGQTLLTIGAVSTGVIIAIFITSVIYGVQASLTSSLTDALPHVTITVEEPTPTTLENITGWGTSGLTSTRVDQQAPQLKNIENWAQVVEVVSELPNVRVVAPAVSGQGFLSKGGNTVGVQIVGADPELQNEVTTVTKNLIAGRYLGLASDEIVIDTSGAACGATQSGGRDALMSLAGSGHQ